MVLVVLSVSGAALALFTDTASIKGITFATGTVDLLVGPSPTDLRQNWAVLGSDFQFLNLFPGYTNLSTPQKMSLKNNSSVGLNLKIDGKIDNLFSQIPPGSFNVLKDVVYMGVIDTDDASPVDISDPRMFTLNEWVSTSHEIVDNANALTPGEIENYNVIVMVDPAATNSISNKVLANLKFDLIGIQAP